jgi:uncharacterized membrane protein YphA (DoxX/SURF4 family)
VTSDTVNGIAKPGGYLRQHRIKLAVWIAVAEGILVLVGVIPRLAIYVLAVVAILFYVAMARNYRSNTARQVSWIFATSQLLTVLVPVLWVVAKWGAIIAIIVIAVAGLVFLFTERDRHHHV